MLRRVARQNVRLGMYIEGIEGDWLNNPFWTTGFVLTKPADLEKLQRSSVEFVIVDDEKSLFGEANAPVAARGARPVSEQERILQSAQACRRAVRDVFLGAESGGGLDIARSGAVVDLIARSLEQHPTALISLTRLKTMESYTFAHSVSVSALLVRFARHLEREEAEVREIGLAGLLHDIGKMRIDRAILLKTSALDAEEMDVIRTHPVLGFEMLSQSPDLPPLVLDICRHHHERIDGTGYPDGLVGEAVSFHARIAAICDVFDALTTVRPYKIAWSTEKALSSMASWTGHFDPDLLGAFAVAIGRDERLVRDAAADESAPRGGTAVNGYSDPGA